jgi:hypothetical protein
MVRVSVGKWYELALPSEPDQDLQLPSSPVMAMGVD